MEIKTGNRLNPSRLQVLPGGKQGIAPAGIAPEEQADIVCHYGVVVQRITVAGMELVEFEFLPDAA